MGDGWGEGYRGDVGRQMRRGRGERGDPRSSPVNAKDPLCTPFLIRTAAMRTVMGKAAGVPVPKLTAPV